MGPIASNQQRVENESISFPIFLTWEHGVCAQSLSCVHVWLPASLWTIAFQTSLSMAFSRQEYWNGLPFPSPGDLPNPEIEPRSPALQAGSLPPEPPGKCTNEFLVGPWKLPLPPCPPSSLLLTIKREPTKYLCPPKLFSQQVKSSVASYRIKRRLMSRGKES